MTAAWTINRPVRKKYGRQYAALIGGRNQAITKGDSGI
jgi:hypothetical protein